MREFTTTIRTPLINGLRKDDRDASKDFLELCSFLKATEFGLRDDTAPVDPFEESPIETFPFPQLIRGTCGTFLAGSSYIDAVTESSPYWTRNRLSLYDSVVQSQVGVVNDGGVWHLIDMGKAWILLNGSTVVMYPAFFSPFDETDKVFTDSRMLINTGCAFKGRAIFGGFSVNQSWTVDWKSLFEHWQLSANLNVTQEFPLKKNFIFWSSIGGGDVFNFFFPSNAVSGLLDDKTRNFNDPLFLDHWKMNQCGFMPMQFQGEVMATKPLGEGVMVYGEDGVGFVYPTNVGSPTLGYRNICSFGTPQRGSYGGDEKRHIWIDSAGVLWLTNADLSLVKLGYKEYLSPLLSYDIVITHNAELNEFYISGQVGANDFVSYTLSQSGLSRSRHCLTSGVYTSGAFLTVGQDLTDDVVIKTAEADFNFRDVKTITTIEIGGQWASTTTVYAGAYYKSHAQDSWHFYKYVLINKEGFGRIQLTAIAFKIEVTCSTPIGTEIDYINLKVQPSGLRTIRGIYANEASSGQDSSVLG